MLKFFLITICCIFLSACHSLTQPEIHDDALNLEKSDYESLLLSPTPAPPKPKIKRILTPVLPLNMKTRISVNISEEHPAKDFLLHIAQQSKVNIVIDPAIMGSLCYQAQSERFIDIINHVCSILGLRYQVKGQTLKIEPDVAYMQTYHLQFPNITRENKNKISTATDVFTATEGYKREFDNGSSSILSATGKADFWQEITENLKELLEFEPVAGDKPYKFTINRQAGLINIYAPFHVQEKIQTYLNDVILNCQQQVLIEAKIVEVNLNREHQSGINWQTLESSLKINAPFSTSRSAPASQAARNVFAFGYSDKNLSAIAMFLNKFGTVRTLSSPRLTVMNNQSAILKVATNFVFFKINYSREFIQLSRSNNRQDLERASSQIQTVPIGLVMLVQPTVDQYTGRITLALRPTISRVVTEKEDPAVAILSKQEKQSFIPEVQVRELDSILQVDSGETIVMGGLMEERSMNDKQGIPGAQDIPFLGTLFGSREDKRSITELVVLLKATLLDKPEVDLADRRLYNVFSKDPRPLGF